MKQQTHQDLTPQNDLITLTETVKKLRVSRPTLYRLIDSGILKTFNIGRRRFTTQKLIDAAVEKLQAQSTRWW